MLTIAVDRPQHAQDPVTGQDVEQPPLIDPATVTPCAQPAEPSDPDGSGPNAASPATSGSPPASSPSHRRPAGKDVELTLPGRMPKRLRATALRRTGTVPVACRLAGRGVCRIRASVSAADARRLGLPTPRGRRRATVGAGAVRFHQAGTKRLSIKLRRPARRGLGEIHRPVRIRLRATAEARGRRIARTSIVVTVRPS